MNTKSCKTCREAKPTTMYSPQPGGKGGVRAHCRACTNAYRNSIKDRPVVPRGERKPPAPKLSPDDIRRFEVLAEFGLFWV